jgi:transcriptional regulator with XRE-family HTH domain
MKPLSTLRIKRLEKGLSQYELAHLAGLSQPKICYAEQGLATLKKDQKKRIAKILGISVASIWEGVERNKTSSSGSTLVTRGGKAD